MHFSCKLTHTILRNFESLPEEFSSFLEARSFPEELIRDPSYWMKAEDFEGLLELVFVSLKKNSRGTLADVAHSAVENRTWGALDSVLRMMNNPKDVVFQPERLLSYFLAPSPMAMDIEKSETEVKFNLSSSLEDFPLSREFLRASFEAIPVFMGLPFGRCQWSDKSLVITWRLDQESLFVAQDPGHHLSPRLVAAANVTIDKTIDNLGLSHDESDWNEIRNHVARLSDYMVRAQQIITLMSAQQKNGDRHSKVLSEILKRVDWEHVQTQFPSTVEDCFQILRKTGPADMKVSPEL